jgi:hypothetical protein
MSIAIFCTNPEQAAVISEKVEPHGLKSIVYICAPDLYNDLYHRKVHGVILELHSVFEASEADKLILQEVISIFPSVKASLTDGKFRILGLGISGGDDAFSAFIEKKCQHSKPREIRGEKRRKINFNVMYSQCDPDKIYDCATCENTDDWTKSFTVNVALSGVFIHSIHPPAVGSTVVIKLVELGGKPLVGQVAWNVEWGKSMKVPGFGIKFNELSKDYQDKIKIMII